MTLLSRITRIALFAALPWEFHAFKRHFRRWNLLCDRPFRVFHCSREERELLLVETGMGKEMVESAMNWVYWSWPFDLLVSFGFAGGLHHSMAVGQCFLSNDFKLFNTKTGKCDDGRYLTDVPAEILEWCKFRGVRLCRMVTTLRHESKSVFPDCLKAVPAAVDMESYFAAAFAHTWRLPFLCFRSISDSCTQELGFQVQDLCDERGQIQVRRVLETITRNPGTIPSLAQSWIRSRKAGTNLGNVVAAFATIPGSRKSDPPHPGLNWPQFHHHGC